MSGLDVYTVKAIEYALGLGFLLLFAGFWRYATTDARPAVRRVAVRARRSVPMADMFRVPDGVLFHPGHAWARADGGGVVTIGLDDFAQQLLGPLAGVVHPEMGATVRQGGRAVTLRADSKSVDLLSPVSGRVVAVNDAAARAPHAINEDPYGRGWLIKVQAPQLTTDRRQLLAGTHAQRWMSASWEDLAAMLTPELGTTMHDGGTPVHGFARGIDEAQWDEIARRFLLS